MSSKCFSCIFVFVGFTLTVLEPFAGKCIYENHGQRVVNGCRTMQPESDIFLGWTRGKANKDFYIRQLRDLKIKIQVETFGKTEMLVYADRCVEALALAHVRSGDAAILCGHLDKSDIFDETIGDFAFAYAN